MRAIAHEVGFSARAIYHYFAGKDDIFVALREEGVRLVAKAIGVPATGDPVKDLRLIHWRYYEFSNAH